MTDVQGLCQFNDMIFLQEHWLTTQELGFIDNVSSIFSNISLLFVNLRDNLLLGHPYDGLSILYKNSLTQFIKKINSNSDRLLMAELNNNKNSKLLLVNCYLLYDNGEDSFEICIDLNK